MGWEGGGDLGEEGSLGEARREKLEGEWKGRYGQGGKVTDYDETRVRETRKKKWEWEWWKA